MSIEVDALSEVYTILKQYIPVKDRQEAADNLMGLLIDVLNDLEVKEFSGTDSALGKAYKAYAAEYEDEYEDDSGYED
jgi:hypothetical protein